MFCETSDGRSESLLVTFAPKGAPSIACAFGGKSAGPNAPCGLPRPFGLLCEKLSIDFCGLTVEEPRAWSLELGVFPLMERVGRC